MRKTSHDGLDSTSITSGLENEIKKNSTAGLIRIKKSSIKRKVPNFSHESDDGIVEPLLQTDRERTETATRSAKYLLSKGKTDSISENEDSIKMSEMKLSHFSSSTPTTTTNKVLTSNNANNVKDTNFVTNITEVAPTHNHMNTNVFGGSEVSKAVISTKSPILVELDVGKTTGYNPSLIFTTAKIHTDCKTKLIEPLQVTPVPITSTFEKSAGVTSSSSDTTNKKHDISGKNGDASNCISEKLNKTDIQQSTDQKFTTPLEIIRNSSTSKNTSNLTDIKTLGDNSSKNMDTTLLPKKIVENKESKNYDSKSANLMTSISNDTPILKNINTDVLKTKKADFLPQSLNCNGNKAIASSALDKPISDNIMKLDTDFSISEKAEKKLTIQGSKKLQRQKKATVDDSHENTSVTNVLKDKLTSEAKKMSIVTTTKSTSTTITTTTSLVNKTTLPSSVTLNSTENDTKTTSQPVAVKSNVAMSPKVIDCKTQPPNSKISTPTTPTSHIKTSLIPTATNRTTQGTNVTKPTTSTKTPEKHDSTNINKSPHSIKPDVKESKDTSSTVNKSPSTPKTLPPYIVSTSKTKIGVPVVTSATLKSEPTKSTVDSKNVPNTKYLVKTTPSSSIRTSSITTPNTSSSLSTKQSVSVKQTKSKTDKQNEDSRA